MTGKLPQQRSCPHSGTTYIQWLISLGLHSPGLVPPWVSFERPSQPHSTPWAWLRIVGTVSQPSSRPSQSCFLLLLPLVLVPRAHLKVYFMENLVCNSLMRIYKVISPTRERLFLYLKQWNTFKYYIFKFSLGGWVGCCYEEKEESGEEVPSMRTSKSEGFGTWESMGCLDYGDHYSITSGRVLKILWRDLKKKKFLTMTLRFLTSNWIDGGAIHWNGEYWERAKFGNSRLVALFYTHWFWEYRLSRKVIK